MCSDSSGGLKPDLLRWEETHSFSFPNVHSYQFSHLIYQEVMVVLEWEENEEGEVILYSFLLSWLLYLHKLPNSASIVP